MRRKSRLPSKPWSAGQACGGSLGSRPKSRVLVGFHCRKRGRCSCVCSRSSWSEEALLAQAIAILARMARVPIVCRRASREIGREIAASVLQALLLRTQPKIHAAGPTLPIPADTRPGAGTASLQEPCHIWCFHTASVESGRRQSLQSTSHVASGAQVTMSAPKVRSPRRSGMRPSWRRPGATRAAPSRSARWHTGIACGTHSRRAGRAATAARP